MNKEDREKELLQAALNIFIEKGYKGTTTAEIAKKADISEVTLFRYFKSKDEIFMLSVKPVIEESLEMLKLDASHEKFKDALRQALIQRVQYINKHHLVIKLILNEQMLLDEYQNVIDEMVKSLQKVLFSYGLKEKIELKQRILMGMFLSFLYHPDTKQTRIEEYIDYVVGELLV